MTDQEVTKEELWRRINPDNGLIREPGKFQPGILGDLLFIFSEANAWLLEMGSNHVRSGVSNHDEIRTVARIAKDALEMWLECSVGDDLEKHHLEKHQAMWNRLCELRKLGHVRTHLGVIDPGVHHLDPPSD